MKNYQGINESIRGVKKPLIIIALSGVLLNLGLLLGGIIINLKKGDRKYSSFEACYYGMREIFNHGATSDLHHPKVLKDLKGKNFKVDHITLIKLKTGHTCDVIAKDEKGFRSYEVTLEKNSKFKHFYRIFDVRGQKMTSTYQYK